MLAARVVHELQSGWGETQCFPLLYLYIHRNLKWLLVWIPASGRGRGKDSGRWSQPTKYLWNKSW